jgi:hypothetical protein
MIGVQNGIAHSESGMYDLAMDGRRKDRLEEIHCGMRDFGRCGGRAGKKPNASHHHAQMGVLVRD